MVDKLALIDAYGFLFRAYFALPKLSDELGRPTGAISGFLNMIVKILKEHEFDYVLVAMDSAGSKIRNEIYSDYKANRDLPPSDLIDQFAILREALEAFGLFSLEKIGYEADDILATVAKIYASQELEVSIISSDKDLWQLMSPHIKIFDAIKSKYLARDDVVEKFGIYPEQVLDFLSLMGDASDNIPGVTGIGKKTAADLLTEFQTLDNLYENIGSVMQKRRKELLLAGRDNAYISRKLVRLVDDLDLDISLADMRYSFSINQDIIDFLQKYSLKNIMSRLEKNSAKEISKNYHKGSTIINEKALLSVENLEEFICKVNHDGKISCILSSDDVLTIYCGNKSFELTKELFDNADIINKEVKGIFTDDSLMKICFASRNIGKFLDVSLEYYDDIQLMCYVIWGREINDIKDIYQQCFEDSDYKEEDKACYLEVIYNVLLDKIISMDLYDLYIQIDRVLLNIVIAMEKRGICVDADVLKNLSCEFRQRLSAIENDVYSMAGEEFNIGSPKQVGEFLFEKMGITGGKKTKSGSYVTDVSVLESLEAQGYGVAKDILEWRKLSKLINTYTDSLPKHINNVTTRVHTTYSTIGTNTGRFSSVNPNLQNIPIRTEEGNKIRSAFVTKHGYKFVSFDYSQIELRLLAEMANVQGLKDSLNQNIDIHAVTASQVFGMKIDEVNAEYRRKAKTINFGIIYGITAFGLGIRLGISAGEASDYIKSYFSCYPEIKLYMDKSIDIARSQGYVQTIYGRRCFIKDINNNSRVLRGIAERAAINAPLQGSAADIIRKSIIKVDSALRNKDADMVLQIHDELLLEVREEIVEEVIILVKESMENIQNLAIRLPVNVSCGNHWGEL